MPNVNLRGKARMSTFRKLAMGTWQDAYDPTAYGSLRMSMDEALRYMEAFRKKTGKKVTVTHLTAKALAMALQKCPEANSLVRWNRVYLREQVDLSLQVAIQDGEGETDADLSVLKIERVDEMSLAELVDAVEVKAKKVKKRQDEHLEKTRTSVARMPHLLMNLFMKVLSLLLYTFNIDMRWAGLPKDAFGSAFVTSIGSLGLELGFVPLVPYSRVPILLAPGVVRKVPKVLDDDTIGIGHEMFMSATFDHRNVDGFHAGLMQKVIRAYIEQPFEHFDKLEDESPAEESAD